MSRKAIRPQRARHIFVYDEDWEFLERWIGQWKGDRRSMPIGVGAAIRDIVHARVTFLRSKQIEILDSRRYEEPKEIF